MRKASKLGNSVPHLHMHWGPDAVYDWEDAPLGDNLAVVDLYNDLNNYLEEHSYE